MACVSASEMVGRHGAGPLAGLGWLVVGQRAAG